MSDTLNWLMIFVKQGTLMGLLFMIFDIPETNVMQRVTGDLMVKPRKICIVVLVIL